MNRDFLQRVLFRRRDAYRGLFDPNNLAARIVLSDLKRFCKAIAPSVVSVPGHGVDPIATAVNEGRREVWNRIQSHIHLSDHTIWSLNEEKPHE